MFCCCSMAGSAACQLCPQNPGYFRNRNNSFYRSIEEQEKSREIINNSDLINKFNNILKEKDKEEETKDDKIDYKKLFIKDDVNYNNWRHKIAREFYNAMRDKGYNFQDLSEISYTAAEKFLDLLIEDGND